MIWHNDINSDSPANMALSAYGLQAEPRFGGAGFSVLKAFRFHGRMAVLFGITWIASAADGDKQKSPARCIRAGLLSILGGGRSAAGADAFEIW